jgi:hypothetical protein
VNIRSAATIPTPSTTEPFSSPKFTVPHASRLARSVSR